MGSATSKNAEHVTKFGGIHIKADRERYYPGEQFNGVIYLHLTTHFPGDSLYVRVKCTEKYIHTKVPVKTLPTHLYIDQPGVTKRKIIDTRVPVHSNNGNFQPGHYAFPISFLIPTTTPGSVYHEGDNFAASIEFSVNAYLQPTDTKGHRLSHKEVLIIEERQQPQTTTTTQPRKHKNFDLKCCWFLCCCGKADLTVALDREYLTPGETVDVRVTVDNTHSKLSWSHIRCDLIEEVIVDDGTFRYRNIPVTVEVPGVKKKTGITEKTISLALPPYYPSKVKSRRIPLKATDYDDVNQMVYPKKELIATTTGRSFSVRYTLAVELIYTDTICCCLTEKVVYLPVHVRVPSFKSSTSNIQVPHNWNPRYWATKTITVENYVQESVKTQTHTHTQQQKDTNLIVTSDPNSNIIKPNVA